MTVTKFTYEQYCTHIKKNIIIEETLFEDGRKKQCVQIQSVYTMKRIAEIN